MLQTNGVHTVNGPFFLGEAGNSYKVVAESQRLATVVRRGEGRR